jgi:hypothetical protein
MNPIVSPGPNFRSKRRGTIPTDWVGIVRHQFSKYFIIKNCISLIKSPSILYDGIYKPGISSISKPAELRGLMNRDTEADFLPPDQPINLTM